jgi:hypothetical protein
MGRVAVRRRGSFRVGRVDGINATYCAVLQRADIAPMGDLWCYCGSRDSIGIVLKCEESAI